MRPGRRRHVPAFVVAVVASVTLMGTLAAAEPTVHRAGALSLGSPVSERDVLAVDPSRHRGYFFARSNRASVLILDLKRMRLLRRIPAVAPDGPFAVDSIRHRVMFARPRAPGQCPALWVFDGVTLAMRNVPLPCSARLGALSIDALAFDAPLGILTIAGRRGSMFAVQDVRLTDDGASLNWEATSEGACAQTSVARMKHGVAGYCSGRGAFWIPTWHGLPIPDAVGHPIIRTTRVFERSAAAAVDARTGRVAISSENGVVHVYDAPDEKRVATMLSPDLETAERAVASTFDERTGRFYVLRGNTMEITDVRGDATVSIARFQVLRSPARALALDSKLHRIFAVSPTQIVAIQDDRPVVWPTTPVRRVSNATTVGDVPATVFSDSTGFRVAVMPVHQSKMTLREAAGALVGAILARERVPIPSTFALVILPLLTLCNPRSRFLLRAPPVAA